MVFSRRPSEKTVRDALADIVPDGVIGGVQITDARQAIVTLDVGAVSGQDFEALRQRAEQAVAAIRGVKQALVILTAERKPPAEGAVRKGPSAPFEVAGVHRIIAVASGKGGVGKSTVAVNLAAALSGLGLRVGLLDADIYGPSLPRLTGTAGIRPSQLEDGRLLPVRAHGLKLMSMGFLVAEETPMIWRGPMVQSALQQLLRDVAWNDGDDLDVLIVDMPPGTGDAQLTLAQKVRLAGAVIVSTPQDIALIDARKGLEMFRQVTVPILGLIENMSYFCCPSCGHRAEIFGHGGARGEAEKLGVAFLGEIPLHIAIRDFSDRGTPIVTSAPASEEARAFVAIAARVQAALAEQNSRLGVSAGEVSASGS